MALASSLRVSTPAEHVQQRLLGPEPEDPVFGHDFEAALDVVGHEYTHGVVQYAVAGGNGLIYQGESGALNESYADILGSLIENKTGAARWRSPRTTDAASGPDAPSATCPTRPSTASPRTTPTAIPGPPTTAVCTPTTASSTSPHTR